MIDTGSNSPKNWEQHSDRPHIPILPTVLDSSRTPDLPQFNPRFKYCGQILNQLPEINPTVRSKIKQDFRTVKGVFYLHKLHFQLMLFDFLHTNRKSVLFFFPVILMPLDILIRGYTNNIFQRLRNILLRNFMLFYYYFTKLDSPAVSTTTQLPLEMDNSPGLK